jgi:polyphosphate kinase
MDELMASKPAAGAKPKMKRKAYEKELRNLQVELCHLQDWVKAKGARIIVVFEGRDAAGKGGTIKAITERVSPRVFRVVALPAPSDREKTQMFGQRYIQQFPAAGEIVIFDRSWYNRAGVEYVMGFCSEHDHGKFLDMCPQIERYIVDGGIQLLKIWLNYAPWYIVRSDDKRRARLNCISHILKQIPFEKVSRLKVKLPKRSKKHKYDEQLSLKGMKFVAEIY